VKIFEELHEHVLNEVLWGHASREVVCDDAMNLGMKGFNEACRGGFVSGFFPCDEVVLKGLLHRFCEIWVGYTKRVEWLHELRSLLRVDGGFEAEAWMLRNTQ
jgi:hypothetical protein